MVRKKALNAAAIGIRRSLILKSSLFILFLFSISLLFSPGAIAEDFCDKGGVIPPRLILAGEPAISMELAMKPTDGATAFEPLMASVDDSRIADDGDDSDDGGDDSQDIDDGAQPDNPDIEAYLAPDMARGPGVTVGVA